MSKHTRKALFIVLRLPAETEHAIGVDGGTVGRAALTQVANRSYQTKNTSATGTTGPVSSSRWTCAKGNVAFLFRDSLQSNSNPTAAIAATPHLRMNTDS